MSSPQELPEWFETRDDGDLIQTSPGQVPEQVERLERLLTRLEEMAQERDTVRQEVLTGLRRKIAGLLGNGTADELPYDSEYVSALNDVLRLLDEAEGEDRYTTLVVPDSPKMLMETLTVAQIAIDSYPDQSRITAHRNRLGRLINECVRHRPLGSDGKHGDLHTPTCGCEDK